MADTNSKYRLGHKDKLRFIYLWLVTHRISKFLIWTKKKEFGFVCENNSYRVWSWILWINVRSARTVLSLRFVVTVTIPIYTISNWLISFFPQPLFNKCSQNTRCTRCSVGNEDIPVNKANSGQEFPESKSRKGTEETSNFNNVLYVLISRTRWIVE